MSQPTFMPVIPSTQFEGAYLIDPTYDGDVFELTKDEQHQLDMRQVRVEYTSGLRGRDTKKAWICTHANWEGEMLLSREGFESWN